MLTERAFYKALFAVVTALLISMLVLLAFIPKEEPRWVDSDNPKEKNLLMPCVAAKYNNECIPDGINSILAYMEGSFGAYFLIIVFILTLFVATRWAIAKKRNDLILAVLLLSLTVASFTLRASLVTFIND